MTAPRFACYGWPALAAVVLSGCAVTIDRDQALTVVPYTVQPTGRLLVDVHLNEQGPFRFAIDTAATGSFVFTRPRQAIALEPLPGTTTSVYGAVASGHFPVVEIDTLTVGDVVWANARLIALPATTIATTAIDGVLGADFLRRYALSFEVRTRMLRLYRPETIGERNYQGWSPLGLEARVLGDAAEPLHFLEIEIAGNRIPALLDLGAGTSILNTPAAQALRLEPTRRAEAGEFAGALGSEPVIARLGTQDLETERIHWRNESFLIADPAIFSTLGYADRPLAILGSGLFSQRDFIIDFARSRLLIRWSMSEQETRTAETGTTRDVLSGN